MHRSFADRQPADVRYSYFVLMFLEIGKAFVIFEYHEVFPMRAEDVLSSGATFIRMSWNQRGSRSSGEAEIIRDRATQGCLRIFYEVKFIGFLFSILSHLI